MKIKHQDIVVEKEIPIANCQLYRSQYASTLTSIIKTYKDGFVLAINSPWGTGKATFVKMWKQHLENEGFQTLYFNAWENDFEGNPLVAFLAELKPLVNTDSNEQFKNLLKKGAVIAKNIAPLLVKAVAEKYVSLDVLKELVVEGTKSATDILEDEIDDYTKKKKGIREFRTSLEEFIASIDSKTPIVFIIDELDRCRPSYAVELLEQVKHFFAVEGIVFALSIDKEQLGHAIRGAYGSEKIDADEYLRRFIDLEYIIPEPDRETFVEYLYKYFEFDQFFMSKQRWLHHEFQSDGEKLLRFGVVLFSSSSTTLRQQEKVFAQVRLVLSFYSANQHVIPALLLALIYFKNLAPDFYNQLRLKRYSIGEVLPALAQRLISPKDEHFRNDYVNFESLFALLYYSYINPYQKEELITTDNTTGKLKTFVRSQFDFSNDQHLFLEYLKRQSDQWNYRGVTMGSLFKKIDLIENTRF